MPRRKANPHRLTDTVQREIFASMELGYPAKLSAQAAGIPERTFYYWRQQGAAGVEPYASFFASIERSRAIGGKHLWTRMLRGEKGSAAAQWALERLFPDEFGPRVMIGGIPEDDPGRFDTADRIRESPEATKLLHQAIVEAAKAMDSAQPRDEQITPDREAQS